MALTAGLDHGERIELSKQVAQRGFLARVPGRSHTIGELAKEFAEICKIGLTNQQPDDLHFIDPILEIVETGRTQADEIRELWQKTSRVDERVKALAYPGLEGRLK